MNSTAHCGKDAAILRSDRMLRKSAGAQHSTLRQGCRDPAQRQDVAKERRCTAQHSTAQHSTAQHSTAQHSTAQLILSKFQFSQVRKRHFTNIFFNHLVLFYSHIIKSFSHFRTKLTTSSMSFLCKNVMSLSLRRTAMRHPVAVFTAFEGSYLY